MKKGNKFAKLISFILLIMSFTLFALLIKLNVLPNKYFTIVSISLLVGNFILFLLLRFSKNKFIKLVSLLCCFGLGYGIFSLFNTNNLLTSMNINYKTNNYIVIVKKDKSYNKLNDLKNKKIGYLKDDSKVLKKIRISFKDISFDDVNSLVDSYNSDVVDAIVVDNSYLDLLNEEGINVLDYSKKIYDFKMNTKVTNLVKDVDITEDTFAIYISGIDTYGSISSVSRTDANVVMIINPKSNHILMISIPRDYYINLYGKNAKDKLTHSGIYGIDTTIKSIEELLDIQINYYYKVNFTSIVKLVDILNGVDVESKYTFISQDGYSYKEGINHLNGKEALSFVRERKSFNAGDRVRNIHQQSLITSLFNKCISPSIITNYNSIISSVKDNFVTNMPQNRLTDLIKKQIDTNAKWNITSYYLDGQNSNEYTYSYKKNKLYVMIPNIDTINTAKQMIEEIKKES